MQMAQKPAKTFDALPVSGETIMNDSIRVSSIEASIDALIEKVGRKLVLAMPLGIGKPNVWINALYRRAKSDPSIELRIITALSLDRPKGRSLVERRFLDPFVQRIFGDYPDMDYALDARRGKLPHDEKIVAMGSHG